MYNGGTEYKGGFITRAFGIDRLANRNIDLQMFKTDLPASHPVIKEAQDAVGKAMLNTLLRLSGVFVVAAIAAQAVLK